MNRVHLSLSIQPVHGEDGVARLEDKWNVLRTSEHASTFSTIMPALAEGLRFELVEGSDELRVRMPVIRRWNGNTINHEDIPLRGELVVKWTVDEQWHADWTIDGDLFAQLEQGHSADFFGKAVCRRTTEPTITAVVEEVAYADHEVTVTVRIAFVECPRRDAMIRFDGRKPEPLGADDRVRVKLPIPLDEPQKMAVAVSVADVTPPLTTQIEVTIPTRFDGAEISTDGRFFSKKLLVHDVPRFVRFEQCGYAPSSIRLTLHVTPGSTSPRALRARKLERKSTTYELELDEDTSLSFRKAVPGDLSVSVDGQAHPDPAAKFHLIPGVIRGVWQDGRGVPWFDLVSSEIAPNSIRTLANPFQSFPRQPDQLLTAPTLSIAMHADLGDITVPIDDRPTKTAFLEDAARLWSDQWSMLELITSIGTRMTIPHGELRSEIDAHVNKFHAARCFAHDDGSLFLIGIQNGISFRKRISPSAIAAAPRFGLFFRGFCRSAFLKTAAADGAEGKLLLLDEPMPVDASLPPPASTFLPLRIATSPDQRQIAIWRAPDPAIVVEINDSIPEHPQLAYFYADGDSYYRSVVPAADGTPSYLAIHNLVFRLSGQPEFCGWWLPRGRNSFVGVEPFSSYTFDFAGQSTTPYIFRLERAEGAKLELIESGSWLEPAGLTLLQDAVGALIAEEGPSSAGPLELGATGARVSVKLRQRDRNEVIQATVERVMDSHEVGFYEIG
ncbi:MAG: hypothetical protein ACXW4P_03905 [Thermoanaerobaculia bacterium]